MTIVLLKNATYDTCPVCEGKDAGCWLCKGKGQIPFPEASYLAGSQAYSNSWWACECFKDYLHPENHECCNKCGMPREEGSDAVAAEAILFVSKLMRTQAECIDLPAFAEIPS